jgi:hypothetical protein
VLEAQSRRRTARLAGLATRGDNVERETGMLTVIMILPANTPELMTYSSWSMAALSARNVLVRIKDGLDTGRNGSAARHVREESNSREESRTNK